MLYKIFAVALSLSSAEALRIGAPAVHAPRRATSPECSIAGARHPPPRAALSTASHPSPSALDPLRHASAALRVRTSAEVPACAPNCTVFGASGGTGSEAVLQALDRGEEVTCLVRDKAKLQAPRTGCGYTEVRTPAPSRRVSPLAIPRAPLRELLVPLASSSLAHAPVRPLAAGSVAGLAGVAEQREALSGHRERDQPGGRRRGIRGQGRDGRARIAGCGRGQRNGCAIGE